MTELVAAYTPPEIPSKWEWIIKLTQEQIAYVSEEDYERVAAHKWYAVKDGKTWYAKSRAGIRYGSPVSMHRFILNLDIDDPEVDHINRCGLDNRRENLRLATRSQNASNRSAKGFTIDGAGFRKKPYKVTKNHRYIGRFATEEEARSAYDNA